MEAPEHRNTMKTERRAAGRAILRCPACGQGLESPPPPRCPLCQIDFHDDRITGADVTPYSKSFSMGEPGWRPMCEWVWYAGWSRLKHLMLMRASAASRQFARVNMVLLAMAFALYEATRVGWRGVADSAASEPTGSTEPGGSGWLHVAGAPRPLPSDLAAEVSVDLWWNPVHAVVAGVISLAFALLLIWGMLFLVRAGVTKAHKPVYRSEQRLTAALHYSFAWGIPTIVAAVLVAFRPISNIGAIARWSWFPTRRAFEIPATVLAAFAMIMWWFWLVCVGNAAPADTRGRVVAFLGIGVPLIVAPAVAGWWFGLDRLYTWLFRMMSVQF